uniref:Peptidase A2 domain-containing protein n=1 Tax=Parastrongyloides trichosuri TaxID=131310 RepID=A0A0N4ZDA5_PARTI
MNVRFGDGSNANLALFKYLTTTIEPLGLPKELAKSIVMMLYVHKVPRMVKERLDDMYTLPQYDDLYEIAKKVDIRYSQKEHFGERRTDRRDSLNDSERNRRDSGLRKQDFKEKSEYGDGCYYDKNDKNDKRPKVGLKKQNEERKNDNDKIVKTYFVDTDDNVPIYTDITFEGAQDGPLTVMVDTGSDNCVMTIEDFEKLPPTIKNKLVKCSWLKTEDWHGKLDSALGSLNVLINIANINVIKHEAKFIVGKGKVTMLGRDLVRQLGINPLDYENKSESAYYTDTFVKDTFIYLSFNLQVYLFSVYVLFFFY